MGQGGVPHFAGGGVRRNQQGWSRGNHSLCQDGTWGRYSLCQGGTRGRHSLCQGGVRGVTHFARVEHVGVGDHSLC